ncbi:MAG TPA: amidohydrolase family protein, partial [Brevundimonas sp.]|nr:amidohydrolase family protein [Brevundimonas sp.]
VIDGGGGFASPGLWDMHIHALSDPDAATGRVLPLLISHGVTGIRDMGSLVPGITATRARLADDPALPRPRLYVSGPLLDGQALPWYGELPLVLKTPAEVGPAVDRLKSDGMDFLKIYSGLAPEVMTAIASEARRAGLPTAGHITLEGGMAAAAASGQTTFEHLSIATFLECLPGDPGFFDRWVASRFDQGYDAYWDLILDFDRRADWAACDARFRDLAAAGVVFTPTLVMEFLDREGTDLPALGWLEPRSRGWCETNLGQVDAADPARRAAVYAFYRRAFDRMRAAGIRVTTGSDSPNFCLAPGSSLLLELERLVELGLTPAEAIAASTSEAARVMGRAGDLGRIAPGYGADIVVTPADPLQDIRAFRDLSLVIAAGKVHGRPAMARMRQAAVQSAAATPPT